jgi:hypothetical protein
MAIGILPRNIQGSLLNPRNPAAEVIDLGEYRRRKLGPVVPPVVATAVRLLAKLMAPPDFENDPRADRRPGES